MTIFFKRALRRILLFALVLTAPVFAANVSRSEIQPPAGFYLKETDAITQRIAQHLTDNGFIVCTDPSELPELVRRGQLDCGVIFPENFSELIRNGQLHESIGFYISPSSYGADLYKGHVSAAVFKEYVPYISSAAFEETPVTQEEAVNKYFQMFEQGYAFSFDITTLDAAPPETVKNRSLVMGAAAIALFAAALLLGAEIAGRAFMQMLPRLGLRKTVFSLLLPELLLNLFLSALFCGCGLWLSGFPELIVPAALYTLAVCGTGLIGYAVMPSAKAVYVTLPVLVLCSVALCPLYIDLSLILPAVATLRLFLPPYWLWCIPEALPLWLLVAPLLFTAGIAAIVLRYRKLLKYRF